MSNNIHDTDVELIRKQVDDLIDECENLLKNGESLSNYETSFSNKYKHLITTSNTLYKFICTQMQQNFRNFNRVALQQRLDMMLNAILNIQNSKISQYDASVMIGEKLAKDYIPQCREPDN
jgi:DNA polymerase III gamma/tau subunit